MHDWRFFRFLDMNIERAIVLCAENGPAGTNESFVLLGNFPVDLTEHSHQVSPTGLLGRVLDPADFPHNAALTIRSEATQLALGSTLADKIFNLH